MLISGIAVLSVLGAVVLSVRPVVGGISSAPPAPFSTVEVTGSVQANPPDGGIEVFIPGRVDTNVTNDYVPNGMGETGPKLIAEVTGMTAGPVITTYSGTQTVALNSSASALLAGQRNCTYAALGRLTATPDGGVFHLTSGKTGASFKAHGFGNNVDYVSCWPHSGAGPLPNCVLGDGGVGYDLHNHEVLDVDLNTALAWKVDCLTCVHSGGPAQDNALVTGVASTCTPPP
jgi:hypothetical protein